MSGVHPETALQIKVRRWVGEMVVAPHVFLSFDRSRDSSGKQHLWEKHRGVRRGTADTLLMVRGVPDIWCELKAGRNTPSEFQIEFGRDVLATGRVWFWAKTVQDYCAHLLRHDVPLKPMARVAAEHYDRLLEASAIRKAESAAKPARKNVVKPTPSEIQRAWSAYAPKRGSNAKSGSSST